MSFWEAMFSQLLAGVLDSLLALIPMWIVEGIFRRRPGRWWRDRSWALAFGCMVPVVALELAWNGHVGYQLVPVAGMTSWIAFHFQGKDRPPDP